MTVEFTTLAKLLDPNAPSPMPSWSPSPMVVNNKIVKLQPTMQLLNILFILDPTTQIISKSAASNDLAYVTMSITPEQHDFVLNLQGFVHVLKNSNTQILVCMQEWVSLQLVTMVAFLNYIQVYIAM
jgi:hypothetical protein